MRQGEDSEQANGHTHTLIHTHRAQNEFTVSGNMTKARSKIRQFARLSSSSRPPCTRGARNIRSLAADKDRSEREKKTERRRRKREGINEPAAYSSG